MICYVGSADMCQCWLVRKWLVTATWFSVFPHCVVGHYPIMSGSRNQVMRINFSAEKSVEENRPLVSWFKSIPLRWVFVHSTWWHLARDSQCFARCQKCAHCNYHPTDKMGSVGLSSSLTCGYLISKHTGGGVQTTRNINNTSTEKWQRGEGYSFLLINCPVYQYIFAFRICSLS